MGFRIGWFAKKWFGITWGPKGGFRLYGMFGGGKGGCLVSFLLLLSTGVTAAVLLVLAVL